MVDSDVLKQLKMTLQAQKQKFEGKVKGTSRKFGFVTLKDGRDIFIPANEMLKVLPGDRVEVHLIEGSHNEVRAEIIALLGTTKEFFMGRVSVKKKELWLEPDDPHLHLKAALVSTDNNMLKTGDYVLSRLLEHPFKNGIFSVALVERVGDAKTIGIESLYTLKKYALEPSESTQSQAQVAQLDQAWIEKCAAQRNDLSTIPFITIDNSNTLDIDDAIFAEKTTSGFWLRVAIADPSAFFGTTNPLDYDAYEKGASAYIPGRTIAMLPEKLTHDLCSLLPNQRRLALICNLELDSKGKTVSYKFEQAIICSHAKLSYEQMGGFLDSDHDPLGKGEKWHDSLQALKKLYPLLTYNRSQIGLAYEDRPDYFLKLNAQKKLLNICKVSRNTGQKLVEECMISANLCAANFMIEAGTGFFITHDGFKEERMEDLKYLLSQELPEFSEGELTRLEDYKNLSALIASKKTKLPLRSIVNRYLKKSQFDFQAKAHFGLGFTAYATFTSPIRKFSDLCVHRIIKSILQKKTINIADHYPNLLSDLPKKLQRNKRIVQETENWLKCEFLKKQANISYTARIVNIASQIIKVQLDKNGIEGVILIKKMSDKYQFDRHKITLRSKKQVFTLDQEIKVKVLEIHLGRKTIEFFPA